MKNNVVKLDRKKHFDKVTSNIKLSPDASMDEIEKYIVNTNKQFRKIRRNIRKKKEIGQLSIEVLQFILSSSVEVLPKVQAAIKKYGRQENIYAAVALTNQIREVMAELRSLSDKSQIPNQILNEVIDIALAEIVQGAQAAISALHRSIHSEIKDPKGRKAAKRQIDAVYLGIVDSVRARRDTMAAQLSNIFDA